MSDSYKLKIKNVEQLNFYFEGMSIQLFIAWQYESKSDKAQFCQILAERVFKGCPIAELISEDLAILVTEAMKHIEDRYCPDKKRILFKAALLDYYLRKTE